MLSYSMGCPHVAFMAKENVSNELFGEVINSIKVRIGFYAPSWVRLFRRLIVKSTKERPTCRTSVMALLKTPDLGINA